MKTEEYTKLILSEWLEIMKSKDVNSFFPNNCFPTSEIREEYCSNISERSISEIKFLIRRFIPNSNSYGVDASVIKYRLGKFTKKQLIKEVNDTEYYRRLLTNGKPNWEGLSWILDLIIEFPSEAVKVIDGYFLAHWKFLPDNAWQGLMDASLIIQTRFLDKKEPQEVLLNLKPREFENLLYSLYDLKGYDVELTKKTRDGGRDIIAKSNKSGNQELLLIECKRYSSKIDVEKVRNLLGVITHYKATKGILVTSSTFTSDAQKFANENPSIELVNHFDLTRLLNKSLGSDWRQKLKWYVKEGENSEFRKRIKNWKKN